jgi:hypothetical protein
VSAGEAERVCGMADQEVWLVSRESCAATLI